MWVSACASAFRKQSTGYYPIMGGCMWGLTQSRILYFNMSAYYAELFTSICFEQKSTCQSLTTHNKWSLILMKFWRARGFKGNCVEREYPFFLGEIYSSYHCCRKKRGFVLICFKELLPVIIARFSLCIITFKMFSKPPR